MAQRMTVSEQAFIMEAAEYFRDPGSFIRGMNFLGSKLEKAERLLPGKAQQMIAKAVSVSLEKALEVTLKTIERSPKSNTLDQAYTSSVWRGRAHTLASTVTGGIGGMFGLQAVPIELPVSTMIMLRSIADTAREFGTDLSDPEEALECLVVLALGGPGDSDDASDTAYYGVRLSLAASVKEAAHFIARTESRQLFDAIKNGSAPVLVRFVTQVAALFKIRVTKKLLAQIAPVVGGVGGATVNAAFTEFYNRAARYHFGIRQLEKRYGADYVRQQFEAARISRNNRQR